MRLLCALAIVLAIGCRRQHTATTYESDNVKTQPAPAPEPVAPPSSGEPAATTTSSSESFPMPDGGTLNGDPRGPRPVEFAKVAESALPPLQTCFDHGNVPGGTYDVTVHFIVENPGYTGGVTAKSEHVPKEVLDCCVGVIEQLKFPQYRGPKVERDLSFTYRKTEVVTERPRDMSAPAK